MPQCDVCGNDHPHTMTIEIGSGPYAKRGVFDSFECAIRAVAPRCAHCGCNIIGHGVESDGTHYCCAHCARQMGIGGVADRDDNSEQRDSAHALGPTVAPTKG